MKLISQTKLFFKEGTSDKVYEIDLCEVGEGLYVVNFRYGRRGSTLKEGQKTANSVGKAKAMEVMEALAVEKRKGGYQSETEMFQELPVVSNIDPKTLAGALLQRMADALANTNAYKTEWKVSRVAWRAGEIRLAEAVPYLMKLVEKGDALLRYSCLWALARCADTRAIPTFLAYAHNAKYTIHVRRVAIEGLLRTLPETDKQNLLAALVAKLPTAMQQAVWATDAVALQRELQTYLYSSQTDYFALEYLYSLAVDYPFLQKIIANALSKMATNLQYFRHFRALYKLAELRQDAQLLGIFAYHFEKNPTWFTYAVGEDDPTVWLLRATDEVTAKPKDNKKPKQKVAFSDATKTYLVRRLLRTLHQTGQQDSTLYVKLATATLLQYQPEDFTPATVRSYGYPTWVRQREQYRHTIQDIPACSKAALLLQILHGNNPTLELNKKTLTWTGKTTREVFSHSYYYDGDATNSQSNETSNESATSPIGTLFGTISNLIKDWLQPKSKQPEKQTVGTIQATETSKAETKPHRNDYFPEHWDKFPQAYLQLLLQAKLDLIHEFAYNNLKQHIDYQEIENKISSELLQQLLSSSFKIPNYFGLEIAKKRIDYQVDKGLVLALLQAELAEARQLAREIVERQPSNFVQDTDFVNALLLHPHQDIRQWTRGLLANIYYSEDMQQVIVGKTIATVLAWQENSAENNAKIADATVVLLLIAKELLQTISWKVVNDLLQSPVEQVQVLASELLVLKLNKIAAEDVPVELLSGFINSPIEGLQRNGMNILSRYSDYILVERVTLLAELLQSAYTPVHQEAWVICKRLVQKNKDFAEKLTQILLRVLIKKETYADSHQALANYLLTTLAPYLATTSLKTALNLVYCNFRQGQLVGLHLLQKHTKPEQLTIRQVVALGNHELLAVREYCWTFYTQNIPRLRYEREEALRLLDAKWDDTRQMAMQFFSQHFRAEDWDTDSLVSIADSIRPDVEAYGKALITKFFQDQDGATYLDKLSQHPSPAMQLFVSNYLNRFAVDNPEKLKNLEFYFRSVLTRVNQGRIMKDRVTDFLEQEALKTPESAEFVRRIMNDMVATQAITDKARYILLLQKIGV